MNTIGKYTKALLFISIIALTAFAPGSGDDVINYFGIQETLSFNSLDYKLAWSSHPTAIYYKHEYVPAGDTVEHFHDMVLIDFMQADISLKDAVTAEINTLKERKKTDIVCNYQLQRKTDEYILDFIMSEGNGQKLSVVEWNAYHYGSYTDKNGHKGVLLFGVSHRAYDDQIMPFMHSLGVYRNNVLKVLSKYTIPEIQIK